MQRSDRETVQNEFTIHHRCQQGASVGQISSGDLQAGPDLSVEEIRESVLWTSRAVDNLRGSDECPQFGQVLLVPRLRPALRGLVEYAVAEFAVYDAEKYGRGAGNAARGQRDPTIEQQHQQPAADEHSASNGAASCRPAKQQRKEAGPNGEIDFIHWFPFADQVGERLGGTEEYFVQGNLPGRQSSREHAEVSLRDTEYVSITD